MTLALLAATAACDGSPTTASAFVSEKDGASMAGANSFSFNNTPSHDYATRNQQTATGAAGGIDFTGALPTSNPCYDVSATRSVRTISVTVDGNGQLQRQHLHAGDHAPELQGGVASLAPGAYTFTVVHHVTGGVEQTAWTGPVTVQ